MVYGAIRDSQAIAAMPFGVRALATTPRKTEKKDRGDVVRLRRSFLLENVSLTKSSGSLAGRAAQVRWGGDQTRAMVLRRRGRNSCER